MVREQANLIVIEYILKLRTDRELARLAVLRGDVDCQRLLRELTSENKHIEFLLISNPISRRAVIKIANDRSLMYRMNERQYHAFIKHLSRERVRLVNQIIRYEERYRT